MAVIVEGQKGRGLLAEASGGGAGDTSPASRKPPLTGVDADVSALPTRTLKALEDLLQGRGPLFRLPEPAESIYLAEQRRATADIRVALCLLPCLVFCVLALIGHVALQLPSHLESLMRAAGLGLVIPSSVIAAGIVQSAPESDRSGVAVAVNALILVVMLEWVGAQGVADYPWERVLVVCVPTALILFAGFRPACVVLVALAYLGTTIVASQGFDAPPRSALSWLGEASLLLIVSAMAISTEVRYRRSWAMRSVMQHHAHRDPLTGLRNRRSFEQFFELATSQARREQKQVCFAMIDLDHFKLINDRYGHTHGDAALQHIAELLARFHRRPLDATARLGGEEFGILLYDCDHVSALRHLRELVSLVQAQQISNEDAPCGALTISVGGVVSDGSKPLSMLFSEADRRLYEVKEQGRNGVRIGVPPGG